MENNFAPFGRSRLGRTRRLKKRRRFLLLFLLLLSLLALWNLETVMAVLFPVPYGETIARICREQKADLPLVLALIRTESRFDPQAVSAVGALGLMQIMPKTGEWIAQELGMPEFSDEDLFDIETNLTMGIWYLNWLEEYFQGELPKALAAYNAGPSRVREWLTQGIWDGRGETAGEIPYGETAKYVQAILRRYELYQGLYG